MTMQKNKSRKAKGRSQIEEVKPASHSPVRPNTMNAFEKSVDRNRELLQRLAEKEK